MGITMEDALDEIARAKDRLKWALTRRGVAQLRLNRIADLLEAQAKSLREDAATFAPLDLSPLPLLLDDYVDEDDNVNKRAEALRTLRVPEAEIQSLLGRK